MDQPTITLTLNYEAAGNIRALILGRFRDDVATEQKVREEIGDDEWNRLSHIYLMPGSTRSGYESFLDQVHERWPHDFDGKCAFDTCPHKAERV